MKTRDKVTIGIFVGVAVVAACILALAIPNWGPAHREESGLLAGCPHPVTGILDYAAEDCPDVRWDPAQIPISIFPVTDNPDPVSPPGDAVRAAVAVWNSRLGFDLFELVEELEGADAVFRVGTPVDVGTWMSDASGAVQHRARDTGGLVAEVRTWNTGTVALDHEVNVHELGHLAGLAHDPFADSAVADPALAPIRASEELRRIWITDHDKELLRSLYHQ